MPTNISKNSNSSELSTNVESSDDSLLFIKRLTAIGISTILYLRGAFDESAFGVRMLDDLELKILSERSKYIEATKIIKLLKGAFDALNKKYLKELVLGLYLDEENNQDLIEAYIFKYSYDTEEKLHLSYNNREFTKYDESNLRESTIALLRNILTLAKSVNPPPEECFITIKLFYYEDVTPDDYVPEGFFDSLSESYRVLGDCMQINAGTVMTPYHAMQIKMKTDVKLISERTRMQLQKRNSK